jgi:GAF domain-containing protein
LLLSHLADVVAPAVADEDVVYHIKDNRAMQELIGDDATYLQDCHMLAVPCWAEGEPLAIIALFRDGSQPFHEDVVQTTEAIAPMLGNYLAKIIRVHHRHSPDAEAA